MAGVGLEGHHGRRNLRRLGQRQRERAVFLHGRYLDHVAHVEASIGALDVAMPVQLCDVDLRTVVAKGDRDRARPRRGDHGLVGRSRLELREILTLPLGLEAFLHIPLAHVSAATPVAQAQVELLDSSAGGFLGLALHLEVHRRVHAEALVVRGARSEAVDEVATDVLDVVAAHVRATLSLQR